MNRYLNVRQFLAITILKLIDFGFEKIKASSFFNIKEEFENILKTHKIDSILLLTDLDIEKLADKFYTFLNFNKEKGVLRITNGELAQMWLADFAVKDANYNKYLNSAILKVLNERIRQNNGLDLF